MDEDRCKVQSSICTSRLVDVVDKKKKWRVGRKGIVLHRTIADVDVKLEKRYDIFVRMEKNTGITKDVEMGLSHWVYSFQFPVRLNNCFRDRSISFGPSLL